MPGYRNCDILGKLDAGMDYRLTLLLLPSDSGKGRGLLRQWVRQSRWPVVSLQIMIEHNEPDVFLSYLDRRLMAPPIVAAESEPVGNRPLETGIVILLNALVTVSCDFALVFEDYDRIVSPAIHESMSYMLDYAPPQMHVFLVTHTEPPLPNLPRLRARRQLQQITVRRTI